MPVYITTMSESEIAIPKEVREFMPDWAEETRLGFPRGSIRQYRYGNLHIREYDNEYRTHVDAVDPRKDRVGHLVRDAPSILVGIGCGLAAGVILDRILRAEGGGRRAEGAVLAAAAAAAVASGYASYRVAEGLLDRWRLRRRPEEQDGG